MPADAYQASPAEIRAVYRLAALLLSAVVLSVVPVVWLGHLNVVSAPGWARAVIIVAALQTLYVGWMLNAPDWATAWVVMLTFAGVATVYALATAMVMATPVDHPMIWGIGSIRHWVTPWCGGVVAVMAAATYLSGRTAARIRSGRVG